VALLSLHGLTWAGLWQTLWRAIAQPLVAGRWRLALDDSIHPKSGQHLFAGVPGVVVTDTIRL